MIRLTLPSGMPRIPAAGQNYDPKNEAEFRRNVEQGLAALSHAVVSGLTVASNGAVTVGASPAAATTEAGSVTLNTASLVNVATAWGGANLFLLRDGTNGGMALVLFENGTITIVSQSGVTTFAVTATPTATQIGLQSSGATQLQAIGGASRNGVSLRYIHLWGI